MSIIGRKRRLSVQTKVLVPVVGFLVLLPVITLGIVSRHNQQQVQDQARQTVSTARAVFRQSLESQSRILLNRFRIAVYEPSYQAIARVASARAEGGSGLEAADRTIEKFLSDRLEEYGEDHEVMFITTGGAAAPLGAVRGTAGIELKEFARTAAGISRGGPGNSGIVSLNGQAFNVVSVPVTLRESGELVGTLTVGVRIGDAAVQELKALTNTEILLVTDSRVTGSTLQRPEFQDELLRQVRVAGTEAGHRLETPAPEPVVVNGEHYFAQAGDYDVNGPHRGFRYVLLSSYEQSLRALEDTQRTLLLISIAGILLSTAVVSLFVRRVTHPLRELRDTAEAVGRGDFTRRIGRFSNDECGELAEAFNHMTANLQSSRAELEKTVETLKNTQNQLIQSEKLSAVGQFVAGVAHELNNPLTTVIGFSDLLRQTAKEEKIRHQLDLIAKSAHRCHKIVQSLLSFARQYAPEQKLVKVSTVIDEVLEIMAYELRTSNIKVVREFQDNLPPILADPHQLQQVFVNILGNARQAVQPFRPDGLITVRTLTDGRTVRIEFQDNGPGIRPENVAKIFDPFFTTKPVGKGTGLGMSLTYGIIQEHGGKISVQSDYGHGATFLIEFPVGAEASLFRKDTGETAARSSRPPIPAGKSVLVVDDEEWILMLAQELLRKDGYVVEARASVDEALRLLRDGRKFDVIVSDWKMPGWNGIQFYEHLLVMDPEAARHIMFMTGDVINETFQEFLTRHDKKCLSKPFVIEEFQAAVADMLPAAGADGRS